MKKILAIVLALAMVLSLAACGNKPADDTKPESESKPSQATDNQKDDTKDSYTIGFLVSDMTNEFFSTLEAAARKEAEEAGHKFITLTATNDASKDVTNMEDLLAQKPDVILYNPVDSDAAPDVVAMANEANVPIITVDRNSNGGKVLAHIASDNVFGGELAGKYIVEQLGEKGGEVVEIQGQPGASAANDRGKGFHNIVEKADNIKIVVSQTGNWATADAMTVMENALTSNPDVKAVFCHNDVMALGALEACVQAGRDDIIVVGFDADADARAQIEDGVMAGTIQQLPAEMGKTAVQTAISYLQGESVEDNIGVEVEMITRK